MSFSSKAKNELCRIPLRKKCCKQAELAALIQTSGTLQFGGRERIGFRVNTENASIARRVFMLIKELYKFNTEVMVRKNQRLRKNNSYVLAIPHYLGARDILEDARVLYLDSQGNIAIRPDIHPYLINRRCCRKSYLRGAFLGGGSVSDPEKTYHLEFVTHNELYGHSLCELINKFDLHGKMIERKNNYVVYLKEGEHIVNLLNIIGAHSALLDLENIRIYKDMRNNINRIVNCETANLNKTVNAAMRQIENIEYLRDYVGFEKIPPSLREIADLRLNYADASLKELGEMLDPPVGKSGVNHRLRKLDRLAEDYRKRGRVYW